MKARYTLRTLLVAITVLAIVLGVAWSYPKSKSIPLFDGNDTVALYRGFRYSTDRVYRLVITPYESGNGCWHVDYTAPGSNRYSRYDRNGKKVEQGRCNVNVWGEWIWIEFDEAGNPIGSEAQ